jgi:hypothetical protein
MSLFDGRRGLTKFNRWFTAPNAKLAKLRNESGKTIFSRQSEDALVEIASDACLLEQRKRRLIVADVLAVLEGVGDKVTGRRLLYKIIDRRMPRSITRPRRTAPTARHRSCDGLPPNCRQML